MSLSLRLGAFASLRTSSIAKTVSSRKNWAKHCGFTRNDGWGDGKQVEGNEDPHSGPTWNMGTRLGITMAVYRLLYGILQLIRSLGGSLHHRNIIRETGEPFGSH
jgi:hypothetical protein